MTNVSDDDAFITKPVEVEEAAPVEKRYRTRSTAPLTAPADRPKAEPPKPKPFIDFKGKVQYATTMADIAYMADELLWV